MTENTGINNNNIVLEELEESLRTAKDRRKQGNTQY
jgi:hypothetical protein